MKTYKSLSKLILTLMVFGLLAGLTGLQTSVQADALQANATRAPQLALAVTGLDCSTAPCDLYAKTGSLVLPGMPAPLPVYGYTSVSTDPVTAPGGPIIVVNQDDVVTIILHNDLAEATALNIPGFQVSLDMTHAVPAAGTQAFTFTADRPGTYLYEAGFPIDPNGLPIADGTRQVAMGLYGALIVRPAAAGQAYTDPSTIYDDEALVLISEIDPAFNQDPANFPMNTFTPTYWLLNGQVFPDTTEIETAPGSRVLLRYLNAGILHRTMGLLGTHQKVIARDGNLLNDPHFAVAETLAAGETLDVIATIPSSAVAGQKFALYDTSFNHNSNLTLPSGAIDFGGILTFLSIPGALPSANGPMVSSLAATVAGNLLTVDTTITDAMTGGQTVIALEYSIDAAGVAGSGTAVPFATPAVTNLITFDIDLTPFNLGPGQHILYVRGQEETSLAWGPLNSVVFSLDATGPVTTGLNLSPAPTNGSLPVQIWGTADDSSTGFSTIQAAEFSINSDPTTYPMTTVVSTGNPWIASLYGSLTSLQLAALPEGLNSINVRSQDITGNWGAFSTLDLPIDRSGPQTSALSTVPASVFDTRIHTNLRIEATLTDLQSAGVNSNIVRAEAFFDQPGTDETGFPLMAKDGVFNTTNEIVFANISLVNMNFLAQGEHTLYVHGKDAAGNWGPYLTLSLTVEKGIVDTLGPVFFSLQVSPPIVDLGILAPAAAPAAPSVTEVILTGTATDPDLLSNIARVEYFLNGNDPGQGLATPVLPEGGINFNQVTSLNFSAAIPVTSLQPGLNIISLRAQDSSGNWSTVNAALTVFVTPSAPGTILYLPLLQR
jgi:FtsP/CotA-like multicopper oxidase with cupredoxin domain